MDAAALSRMMIILPVIVVLLMMMMEKIEIAVTASVPTVATPVYCLKFGSITTVHNIAVVFFLSMAAIIFVTAHAARLAVRKNLF